jgi:MFS family permease
MLASTVVMPVFGGLSDRLGRRGPFVAAIVIFCAGSLMAGVATSMPVLVAGRGVQGVGAGGILALSLIIFGDLFAGPRRARCRLITAVWASRASRGRSSAASSSTAELALGLFRTPLGGVISLAGGLARPGSTSPAGH